MCTLSMYNIHIVGHVIITVYNYYEKKRKIIKVSLLGDG